MLIVVLIELNLLTASDIWSRYLLYIPGGLLAAAASGASRERYR